MDKPQDQKQASKKETTFFSIIKDRMASFSSKDSSESSIRNIAKDHKIKIDQRVVVFQGDEPLRGTVRYISERVDKNGDCPVGIELDEKKGDGTGMIQGERLFVCKKDYALFAQVTSLIPEKDFDASARKNSWSTLPSGLLICEQRVVELEASLAMERQAREEAETRLRSSELRSRDLELQVHATEQRTHELELYLAAERRTREEVETRLRSSQQRSCELEVFLNTERQAREESEQSLRSLEQRSRELEQSLDGERQALEETVRRLCSCEQRNLELETTLTTLRQAHDACRRSSESTRDWVLLRDEVILSDTVIGRGAWGEVKEGTFRGCKVAVKEIHPIILSNHNRRLFEREMNMASRCRHPCLLQFIGVTNDEQSPLFVTELMDTGLRDVLHERPLEPPEISTIALDVAKGLNYLHLSHPDPIIHRDISSANVLLWKRVDNWRAKVSDYGTANVLQTSMSVCPGSAAYSAPEALTSRQSPKLDVYSFGILLCEMNIGEMPVEDQRDEQVALVTNNFFRNLIRRCLEQNPEERPSMAEIIEELENFPH